MRKISKIEPRLPSIPKRKKVSAYARVSMECDRLMHSISAQISYYSSLIQSHAEWEYAGVYADYGISGTGTVKRTEFQRMLADCESGKINIILCKSISRFARNTVTLLETVRELKDLGIDVLFEEQNIHSISSDGELMLSILASYAQEESYSASENKKWQMRRDFEQGKIGGIVMLGYRRTSEGSLEIIPDEAEIVKLIFNSYLSGMGKLAIANQLNEQGILTKNGNQWGPESVLRILKNEKYTGTMILQKFYSENHITKRKMKNEGQLQKYIIDESHPAIIEKHIFDAVQKRLQKQKEYFSSTKPTTAVYPFTGKIQCKCCGKNYRRKTTATGVVWICATYNTKGKKYCPTAKQIPENTLILVCCEVLGISEFDANIFENQVEKILVPAPNELTFIFTDGHEISTNWKGRSRSESWTDEMRKKAGERRRMSCLKEQ